jgi:hypothetical protein
MCCGSRRSAWRNASVPPKALSTASLVRRGDSEKIGVPAAGASSSAMTSSISAKGPFPTVTLHYLNFSAISLRGPVTGRSYEFSGSQPFQAVDIRDASVLTRSSSFRRSVS